LTPAVPLGALSAYFFSLSSNDAHASAEANSALSWTAGDVDGGTADPDGGGGHARFPYYRVAYELCQQARADWDQSRVTTNSTGASLLLNTVLDGGP
jgi:hypothetical protein